MIRNPSRRKRNGDHAGRTTPRRWAVPPPHRTRAAPPRPSPGRSRAAHVPAFSKRHQNTPRGSRVLTSGVRPIGCHVASPPMSRRDTPASAGVVGDRDLPRDARPQAVQHWIARNARLRLRRQQKRFTVAVEVSEPDDLRQRHVARPARAARSPHPSTPTPAAATTTALAKAPIAQGRRKGTTGRALQRRAGTHASSAWTKSPAFA